eukprot:11278544-Alexandrium_andersonii.AAC.1
MRRHHTAHADALCLCLRVCECGGLCLSVASVSEAVAFYARGGCAVAAVSLPASGASRVTLLIAFGSPGLPLRVIWSHN